MKKIKNTIKEKTNNLKAKVDTKKLKKRIIQAAVAGGAVFVGYEVYKHITDGDSDVGGAVAEAAAEVAEVVNEIAQ